MKDGNGLLALPEPSEGDLFFDIEGDPHAFASALAFPPFVPFDARVPRAAGGPALPED